MEKKLADTNRDGDLMIDKLQVPGYLFDPFPMLCESVLIGLFRKAWVQNITLKNSSYITYLGCT